MAAENPQTVPNGLELTALQTYSTPDAAQQAFVHQAVLAVAHNEGAGFTTITWDDAGHGVSVGLMQFNQQGELASLMRDWHSANPDRFNAIFGSEASALLTDPGVANAHFAPNNHLGSALQQALAEPSFQAVQIAHGQKLIISAIDLSNKYGHNSQRFVALVADLINQCGHGGANKLLARSGASSITDEGAAVHALASVSNGYRANGSDRSDYISSQFATDVPYNGPVVASAPQKAPAQSVPSPTPAAPAPVTPAPLAPAAVAPTDRLPTTPVQASPAPAAPTPSTPAPLSPSPVPPAPTLPGAPSVGDGGGSTADPGALAPVTVTPPSDSGAGASATSPPAGQPSQPGGTGSGPDSLTPVPVAGSGSAANGSGGTDNGGTDSSQQRPGTTGGGNVQGSGDSSLRPAPSQPTPTDPPPSQPASPPAPQPAPSTPAPSTPAPPPVPTFAQRTVIAAEAAVGQQEWAKNKWGPDTSNGVEGCAASVSQVLSEAGLIPDHDGRPGDENVEKLVSYLQDNGWQRIQVHSLSDVQPGDIIYGDNGGGDEHIGIIVAVETVPNADPKVHEDDNSSNTGKFTHRLIQYSDFMPGKNTRFGPDDLWVLRHA